ncbi:sigma-70 family RNA polymerase sigma factor [Aureibacillus halotolerans]|uniref:RNA polymerase primary sigma factor n=1 Tax=Aureibacillus halotolerans TaxID=1508390 RepID=A0A4R6TT82_9BACI|nr:sigma-70 family RNA polymerase sigma factor [Aureibacillus halotolerans]TDQ32148.1 RNA polymerase primary sigma factor [Aureibacillus halotolerans]
MPDNLKTIFDHRLLNFNSESVINVEWLCNLYKLETGQNINTDKVISYLKQKGYYKYKSTVTPIKSVLDKEHSSSDNKIVQSKPLCDDTINNSNTNEVLAKFNPNNLLDELENDTIDISNITYNDNQNLLKKIKSEEDDLALELLITANLKLVKKIAKKYMGIRHKLEFDDLVNTGVIGMIKAIELFDLSLGYSFSTYATFWIRQSITRYINDNGYTIRIPVHLHETINKLRRFERDSLKAHGNIDIKHITKSLDITIEKYYELKNIEYSFLNIYSLNLIVSDENDDTDLIELVIPSMDMDFNISLLESKNPIDQVIENDIYNTLLDLINELPNRQAEIIKKRMGFEDGEPKTLEEIGKDYSVTRERIRQIEKKAISKLRGLLIYKKIDQFDLVP